LNGSKILHTPYSSSRGFVGEVDDDEIPRIFLNVQTAVPDAVARIQGDDDERDREWKERGDRGRRRQVTAWSAYIPLTD
jgi:hypothetical protein